MKRGFGVLSTETKVDRLNETFSRQAKLGAVELRMLPLTDSHVACSKRAVTSKSLHGGLSPQRGKGGAGFYPGAWWTLNLVCLRHILVSCRPSSPQLSPAQPSVWRRA